MLKTELSGRSKDSRDHQETEEGDAELLSALDPSGRTLHHDHHGATWLPWHQPEESLPSHLTPRHQRFPLSGPE